MIPSFIALFSKAGIACAADTDHTVFRLSDKYPVAIAVNPDSPIPWKSANGFSLLETNGLRDVVNIYAELRMLSTLGLLNKVLCNERTWTS